MATLRIEPSIFDKMATAQRQDSTLDKYWKEAEEGKETEFKVSDKGILMFQGRICVPKDENLKSQILFEAHNTPYSIHPGATKMFQDLKQHFWWRYMKNDIVDYVSRCLTCQKVKAEHKRPAGELQPLDIPEWKWEHITMDFVVGLPKTSEGYDASENEDGTGPLEKLCS